MKMRALVPALLLTVSLIHSVTHAGGWITSGVRAAAPPYVVPAGPLHYECEMVASSSDAREVYTLSEEFTPERFANGGVSFRAPKGPESFLAGQALSLRVMHSPYTNKDTVTLSIEALREAKSRTDSAVTIVTAPREQGSIRASVQSRVRVKSGRSAARFSSVDLSVNCWELTGK